MARRNRLLALGGAGALTLAVLGARVLFWPSPRPDAAPVPADHILVGSTEGQVRQIEPKTRVLQVAPSAVNFGATAVTVTPDTRIVVDGAEGTFGDLREGALVKVAYEVKSGVFLARTIEVLKRTGSATARPQTAKPEVALPETAKPETAPETARPTAARPEAAKPEAAQPAATPERPAAAAPPRAPSTTPAPVAKPPADRPIAASTPAPAPPASAQTARPPSRPQVAPPPRQPAEAAGSDPGAVIDWLLNQSRWRD